MLWVNLIMDTFAAMALSSLPADPRVLEKKPRDPRSPIIDRGIGKWTLYESMVFFAIFIVLWQLLRHFDINSVSALFHTQNWSDFFTRFFSVGETTHYELAIFFSFFVLIQFWNLFNVRYYHTDRSLLRDLSDVAHGRRCLSEIFSRGFLLVAMAILIGQVLIVTFAYEMFNVEPLSATDWLLLLLVTCPILIVGEFIRNLTHP